MKIVKQSFEIISPVDRASVMKHLEICGRKSYKSEHLITETSADKFVRARVQTEHYTILEHFSVTVSIVTTRGVANALTRYRHSSPTQESTIYCNYSKGHFGREITIIDFADYLSPAALASQHKACAAAEQEYFNMLALGEPASLARSVLPTCLKTELAITANLSSWRHILSQRVPGRGDSPLTRDLARGLLQEFKKLLPVVFEDINF